MGRGVTCGADALAGTDDDCDDNDVAQNPNDDDGTVRAAATGTAMTTRLRFRPRAVKG